MTVPLEPWPSYLERHHSSILAELRRTDTLTRVIQSLLPSPGRILEVGCGTAVTSFALAESGHTTVCVDHDPAVLDWIRSRYAFFSNYLAFACADMCQLPFEPQSFDVAFSQGLLEHFDDQTITRALREQRRVAKFVVFDVPNARHANERLRGDERLLSNRHYARLCAEAGLRLETMSGRRWISGLGFLPEETLRRGRLLSRLFAQNTIFVTVAD
jgi:SAM-dependent methyltransferase